MQPDEPVLATMEKATVDLLRLAFIEIRYLTEDRHEDQSPAAAAVRRKRANAIADICHNLPGLLAPGGRDRLADGLRYLWGTANAAKRRWLLHNWDYLAYDHRWLTAT